MKNLKTSCKQTELEQEIKCKVGSQAGGVSEERVRLLSLWPDKSPQVLYGLLEEGVCLQYCWELADPLPYHRPGQKSMFTSHKKSSRTSSLTTRRRSPNNVADLSLSQVPLVWGTVLISKTVSRTWDCISRDIYTKSASTHQGQNNACLFFPSRLKNRVTWLQATDQRLN